MELTFLVPAELLVPDERLAIAAGFFGRPSVADVFFAGFAAGLEGLEGLDFSTALGFLAVFGLDGGAGAAF